MLRRTRNRCVQIIGCLVAFVKRGTHDVFPSARAAAIQSQAVPHAAAAVNALNNCTRRALMCRQAPAKAKTAWQKPSDDKLTMQDLVRHNNSDGAPLRSRAARGQRGSHARRKRKPSVHAEPAVLPALPPPQPAASTETSIVPGAERTALAWTSLCLAAQAASIVIAPQLKLGLNGQLVIDHSSLVQQPLDEPEEEFVNADPG